MKLHVYSVMDKAVGAFLQPFYCRSQGEALRSFREAVNDKSGQSAISKYPADYVLVRLGEWDDVSALFVAGEPTRVISAVECLDNDPIGLPEKEGEPRRLPM